MDSKVMRNVLALSICVALGILAIHGARMILYFVVFDGTMSLPRFLVLDGVYVVAWIPPLGVSFLIGMLLSWLVQENPVRWVLAYGVVVGGIWLLGTTHEFRNPPGSVQVGWSYYLEQYFGTYSWYLMPLIGAWLGSRAARWTTSRLATSDTDAGTERR